MLLVAGALGADSDLEQGVKAAFLYNFAKFVSWPRVGPETDPFIVGVVGAAAFGDTLEEVLAGKSVGRSPIEVRRFASLDELGPCRILFVGRSQDAGVERALDSLPPGILTVGESRAFARAGGMIRFVLRGGKVRFEVDQAAAADAGLEINARLLSVASAVRRGRG